MKVNGFDLPAMDSMIKKMANKTTEPEFTIMDDWYGEMSFTKSELIELKRKIDLLLIDEEWI